MRVESLVKEINADFYTGVPDSQLKALCDYLMYLYGIDSRHHIIAANEGNSVAIAAGYYLSTRKIPVVYLQNSGEGNILNPVASLCNDKVYGIPIVFFIGWRGEPSVYDEPQHIYQGGVTIKLLEDMDIDTFVINRKTSIYEVREQFRNWRALLKKGKQVAFVICKNALEFDKKVNYENRNIMFREEVIAHIVRVTGTDLIVSTTGKASRELFEIREMNGEGHQYDFLTVGSMGHASSIAFGISVQRPNKRVWCIDGDGAVLMHMGAMALIGTNRPSNLIHIVINNGAHDTVGGMPTAAFGIDLTAIAKGCGYQNAVCVNCFEALDAELNKAKVCNELSFIEVKCAVGARENLGRPTMTPKENKEKFMKAIFR